MAPDELSPSRGGFAPVACYVKDGNDTVGIKYSKMCEKIELNKENLFECFGWTSDYFSPHCYGFVGENTPKPVDYVGSGMLIFLLFCTWFGILMIFDKVVTQIKTKKF